MNELIVKVENKDGTLVVGSRIIAELRQGYTLREVYDKRKVGD